MSNSNFHMVDVSEKSPTKRKAEATGSIRMTKDAFEMVRDRALPKGDALVIAEIAGINAAKQTPGLLPLCHPLALEEVSVKCELDEPNSSVRVTCQVSTTAKTGVEMEALVGANVALLCLYDLIKQVEPALIVQEVRLNYKTGGKRGHWTHPAAATGFSAPESKPLLNGVRGSVLTVSDRVSRGQTEDKSGPLAHEWLIGNGADVMKMRVVPDEKEEIESSILELVQLGCDLIVTTGGTGMGPRDITIGTLRGIASKEMQGIGELLRKEGALKKKAAWLSNSSCFVIDKSLVIALPGSSAAVKEGLLSLSDLLPHALHIIRGGDHG